MSSTHSFHPTVRWVALLLVLAGALGLTACDNKSPQSAEQPSKEATSLGSSPQAQHIARETAVLSKVNKAATDEGYVPLNSNNQLMYAYLTLSKKPPDYEKIAARISNDYATSKDEFRKRDLLIALKPQIDTEISAAKNRSYFYITTIGSGTNTESRIGPYDFAQKGFPLEGWSNWLLNYSYRFYSEKDGVWKNVPQHDNDNDIAWHIMFDGHILLLSFNNGDAFRFFNVENENAARQIESLRSQSGIAFDLVVYGVFEGIGSKWGMINAKIVKVVLLDKQGNVLAQQPPKSETKEEQQDLTEIVNFDCDKVRSIPENLICRDPELAAQNRDLALLYERAKNSAIDKNLFASLTYRQWTLRELHCRDKECLASWFNRQKQILPNIIKTGEVTDGLEDESD